MSDTDTAAAAAAGTDGTAAAAGAAAAGAASTTAAPWHGMAPGDLAEFGIADATAYIANKGWNTTKEALRGYAGAEKLIGRDPSTLVPLPKDANDAAGFRAVMSRLGLPESPDKYEFTPPPDGLKANESYEKWARGTFHELGLPAPTVKALTAKHNEFVAAAQAQAAKDYEMTVAADRSALLAEWKGGHERMMASAKHAAKSLGFTPEMIDGIEQTAGYAGTWKFFAALGQKLGEDGFATSGDQTKQFGGQLTPDEARLEMNKMRADPVVVAVLKDKQHPQYRETKAKYDNLFQVMYPS